MINIWRVSQRASLAVIGLLMSADPCAAQTTGTYALVIDSQAGDYLGNGEQRTFTALDGTFGASSNFRNGATISFTPQGTPGQGWWLRFAARNNPRLTPGTYRPIAEFSSVMHGMDVWAPGRICGSITGHFVVLEAEYATDGTPLRFAADFEQHCNDALPGLFGAIRYNSTITELRPFGGAYPNYWLSIVSQTNGRVTGGGLDCGGGHLPCVVFPVPGTTLTITAVPDPGYVFLGWSGDCGGDVTTTVHINSVKVCAPWFDPIVPVYPRTFAYWTRQPPGSFRTVYSPLNSVWHVTSAANGNQVTVYIEDAQIYRTATFSAPEGQRLTPGYYSAARRHPFTPFNGLDVSSTGAGCNNVTGRFVIYDINIGADGTVQTFAADFEHHCEDAVAATFGSIHYNSLAGGTEPFNGAYPVYSIALTPSQHGRVTGTALNCGSGDTQCQRTLAVAERVPLEATPDSGYAFMGWTEDCSGGTSISLHVNGPKRCSALFGPAVPSAPHTVLRLERAPGQQYFGRTTVLSPANSRWTVRPAPFGDGVEVRVESVGPTSDSYWTLWFSAPSGQQLQVGRYTGSQQTPSPTAPGLWAASDGQGCAGGEFTVRQLDRSQGVVQRFAVDFSMMCDGSTVAMTGSLQFNATVDIPSTSFTVEPSTVHFGALHDGFRITSQSPPQIVRLTLGRPDLAWTAAGNEPWVTVSPSSGIGSANLTVNIGALGGHPLLSTFPTRVTITLGDGAATSRAVELVLHPYASGTSSPPFGFVDTPLPDITGVTGAIPITGWALDDVEVTGVTICRAAVGLEVAVPTVNCGGAAHIFIGNATFVEGARPDVRASYPTMPLNDRGGWGLMLLTNMLPNQGNGQFVLYAYARDGEGSSRLLGTRTMTCDNAHATAPFGAIDTPGQGATAFGSSYVNFGWALTPIPKFIPTDGSTITVYVDGVAVGSPTYNQYRVDVATVFPGLANSSGAIGFKIIDTTQLLNGLHTIVWTVTDSAGVTSGIGSRYFRVANSTAITGAATAAAGLMIGDHVASLDRTPIRARRSWDTDAAWRVVDPGASGRVVLHGEELDRFEVALGDGQTTQTGFLRVAGALQPLPAGSALDPQTGVFTWAPGVGFVGTYDLVFISARNGQPVVRREIRFVLHPKTTGRIGARIVIDTPKVQQDVAQPFAMGGWAADLEAASGTGIESIQVWAYPLTGGAPMFLGTATQGGARPDVAAIYGEQFRNAGYGLMVQGLPHGHYDVVVFAWSAVRSEFLPAQRVPITVR